MGFYKTQLNLTFTKTVTKEMKKKSVFLSDNQTFHGNASFLTLCHTYRARNWLNKHI